MHSVGITILDGITRFEVVFDYYAARVHLVPRLRHKVAFVPFNLAHPKWVDDVQFDLANHVRRHQVPPNTTLDRAIDIALEIGEPVLDRNRPLWMVYVIEDVEGKTLLVQLTHHAFADGATMVAMTTVLTDPAPDARAPEPEDPPWQPQAEPSAMALWQEAVTENAQRSVSEAQALAGNAQRVAELSQKSGSLMQRMARPVMQAPWNASLVGPKRSHALNRHELVEMKALAGALGGTINDVVVSSVVEGAARYLEFHREVTQDRYLRLMCPVNIRAADDDPLATGSNRVSAMFPVLPAWSMSMPERLATVQQELSDIKANEEPWVLDQLQQLQPNTPPVAMAQTLSVGTQWDLTAAAARAPLPVMPLPDGQARPQQLGFNFTCTNVAGPNWTQYVCGQRVELTYGTLMLSGNLGLGVAVNSYDDGINFGITADPRLVPDVGRFADYIEEALGELKVHAASMQ